MHCICAEQSVVPQYVSHTSSAVSGFLCFPQCSWSTSELLLLAFMDPFNHTWQDVVRQLAHLLVNTGACLIVVMDSDI